MWWQLRWEPGTESQLCGKRGRIMRWREGTSCGLMSDLIKLVLTSSDAHLSHSAVLVQAHTDPNQDRNSQANRIQVPVKGTWSYWWWNSGGRRSPSAPVRCLRCQSHLRWLSWGPLEERKHLHLTLTNTSLQHQKVSGLLLSSLADTEGVKYTHRTRWKGGVRGCWRESKQFASWCGGRRAGGDVCGGLDNWLPRGSSSNSSRRWLALPEMKHKTKKCCKNMPQTTNIRKRGIMFNYKEVAEFKGSKVYFPKSVK